MIIKFLQEATQRIPKHLAIVYDEYRVRYDQLDSKVQGLSRGLSSLEIAQGDCVALILPNCPEFVYSFYAVAQLNGIILPLDHLSKPDELSYCISDSKVKAVITDIRRAKICQQILAILDRDIELIVVDGIYPGTHYLYNLILPGESPIQVNHQQFLSLDILYQYSWSSPEKPQRKTHTQADLIKEMHKIVETPSIQMTDKVLCTMPFYNPENLIHCLLKTLSTGATLVILEQVLQSDGTPLEVPFELRCQRVLELIETEEITVIPISLTRFNNLVKTYHKNQHYSASQRLESLAEYFLSGKVVDQFLQRLGIPVLQLSSSMNQNSGAKNLKETIKKTSLKPSPLEKIQVQIIDSY